jgi:hypothetical protein
VTPFGLYELRRAAVGWRADLTSQALELDVSTDGFASATAK